MLKKINPFVKKICLHLGVIMGLILLVELFVCNYKHFLIMPDAKQTYAVEQLQMSGLSYNEEEKCYVATKNNPTIEIKDIQLEVKTLFFDANPIDEKKYQMDVKVAYTDETRLNYVEYGKKIQIVQNYENSRYLQEDFNGKTEKLKFTLSLSRGEKITFKQIGINHKIPFHFSFARVFAMLLISLGVYFFVMLFHYRKEIELKQHLNIACKVTVSVLSVMLVLIVYGAMFNGFANSLAQTTGSQISKELVDSFLNGQVSMLEKPSDAFLAIQDPYVPSHRAGVYYLWDHVYYKGSYYSYYGITPVCLLFLPFKVLTGYYMYDGHAVLLFSLISILFLSLAYYKFIKKLCPSLPLFLQLSGYVILFMSCGILTNIVRPAFYEVSTSCAFMCMCIALYHLASSSLLFKEEPLNRKHILWMSIWLSLAVLSRATYALYAICAVIILLIAFLERRKNLSKKEIILFFVSSLTPFVIFGGIQCAYNYARFGNIFEFGIQYSLTINDFTKTQFHFSFAFTSIYNFLFAMPVVSDINYFIRPNALTFGASGYYFFETYTAIGLFNRVPILYMFFALPFLKTSMKRKEKCIFALKYILPCVIVPLVVVMITWESGFAVRYYSDFAWAMVLFALFLFFKFYEKQESNENRFAIKTYAIIIGVTMLCAFVGQMAIIYDFVPNLGRHIGVEDFRFTYKYYRIAKELSFWY